MFGAFGTFGTFGTFGAFGAFAALGALGAFYNTLRQGIIKSKIKMRRARYVLRSYCEKVKSWFKNLFYPGRVVYYGKVL